MEGDFKLVNHLCLSAHSKSVSGLALTTYFALASMNPSSPFVLFVYFALYTVLLCRKLHFIKSTWLPLFHGILAYVMELAWHGVCAAQQGGGC